MDDLLAPPSPGMGASQPGLDDVQALLAAAFGDEMAMPAQADEKKRKDEELVKKLRQEFDWSKKERAKQEDIWDECYKMYRNQMPDERASGEWRSKINVPNAWNAVESGVPHLMEGIWAADKPFRLQLAADDKLVLAHEKLLYWELNELIGAEPIWEDSQRQKGIYGTTAVYTGFRSDYADRSFWSVAPNPDPQAEPQLIQKTTKVPEYVGTTMEVLDIYNLYPHPRSTRHKMPWLFWLRWLTLDEIKKSPALKANAAKLTPGMATDVPRAESLIADRSQRTGSANDTTSGGAELLYPVITKYDEVNKRVITFSYYGDVLLEDTAYPFWHNRCPITFDRVTCPVHEFWGVGFIEPILSLIHEHNSIRNQRRDNSNLTSNAMFEIRDGELLDEEEELVFAPGAVFHTKTGQGMRAVQMPAIPESHQEEGIVQNDIATTTGLSGPVVGQPGGAPESASGISLMQKAQLLRLKRGIKNSALAFKEVISQMLGLNSQFLPLPEVFKVLGAQHFADYSVQDLTQVMPRATIVVQPAGIYEDENIQRQQNTNLLNVLGANPLFAEKVDWDFMLRHTLRLNGIQDTAVALKKPKGMDMLQTMLAFEENFRATQGQPIPQPTPQDDYDVHMQAHQEQMRIRPDLWQVLGQHMVEHDQIQEIIQQQMALQQMAAQTGVQAPAAGPKRQNGPGSAPAGNGGGVNHNRQPQPTNGLGLKRAQARETPRA